MSRRRFTQILALALLVALGGLAQPTLSGFSTTTANPSSSFTAAASFSSCGTAKDPVFLTGFESGAENVAGDGSSYFDVISTAGGPVTIDSSVTAPTRSRSPTPAARRSATSRTPPCSAAP